MNTNRPQVPAAGFEAGRSHRKGKGIFTWFRLFGVEHAANTALKSQLTRSCGGIHPRQGVVQGVGTFVCGESVDGLVEVPGGRVRP